MVSQSGQSELKVSQQRVGNPLNGPFDIIRAVNRRDIFIREATNADGDGVLNLVSGVLAEFQLPFDSKDADLVDIEKMYIQAGGIFEVIEDQSGKLLGTYGLLPLNDIACELRKMYFLREIRGLRVGKEILPRCLNRD